MGGEELSVLRFRTMEVWGARCFSVLIGCRGGRAIPWESGKGPHLHKAGGLTEGAVQPRRGGALTRGRRGLVSAEGNLTCIAEPYLGARGSPGAWGQRGSLGKGQSAPAGRGRGAVRSPDETGLTSLGAWRPGPPGWPGLGVGGAPGGRRPPRPGFAAAATCLHRDQLLPPLRREGEGTGAGPGGRLGQSAGGMQMRGRVTPAEAGPAALPPVPGPGRPGNAAAAGRTLSALLPAGPLAARPGRTRSRPPCRALQGQQPRFPSGVRRSW